MREEIDHTPAAADNAKPICANQQPAIDLSRDSFHTATMPIPNATIVSGSNTIEKAAERLNNPATKAPIAKRLSGGLSTSKGSL